MTLVESPEELARKLAEQTWCLCTGFELDGYLFLNDATSVDGAGEFGVVAHDPSRGVQVQVESITFSWCSYEQALEHVQKAIAGEYDDWESNHVVDLRIETPREHKRKGCHLCA